MDFKIIHIGTIIKIKTEESGIDMSRICNFLKIDEENVLAIYESESIDSILLLRWCKLLEYDFFRYYSQHLILYSPIKNSFNFSNYSQKKSQLPKFRKNIYTKDIIDFVLSVINSGEMTKKEVIDRYRIPKTTLYKWISKYSSEIT